VMEMLTGPEFLRDLVFSTLFAFLTMFVIHIVLLVGVRNFGRMVLGKYRQPRELSAVFMFVDLRGSTSIAEQLGHKRFSAFVSDFFNDLSAPIYRARGEVYQYVGDEVVIVWPEERRTIDFEWLECFGAMKAAIAEAGPGYVSRYGVVPEFKAGAHCGRVMVTEVGSLQRAHVYHGDILNTASRIQDLCNETGFDLLASEALVSTLDPVWRNEFERVDTAPLKGKERDVVVLGYSASSRNPDRAGTDS